MPFSFWGVAETDSSYVVLLDTKSEQKRKEEGGVVEMDHWNDTFTSKEQEERQSLADRLLFPSESRDSSDSEDSDWIVSDGEDSYPDVKELLMDAENFKEGRPPYFLLPNAEDDEETDDQIFSKPLHPLTFHDAVYAVEVGGGGGDREALAEALRQCKDPSLIEATDSQGWPTFLTLKKCLFVCFGEIS